MALRAGREAPNNSVPCPQMGRYPFAPSFRPKDPAMSLTLGTGPFGQHPAGTFNRDLPERQGLIYFEPSPRRIRAVFAGATGVGSRPARPLHERGPLPPYYFTDREVRTDDPEPTPHRL